jgi:acetyl esterase/lipase
MDVRFDIEYANHDGFSLRGDLYRPDGDRPVPAMLLIHGGAMKVGDKSDWACWGRFFAANGLAAFSVNYRLLGDHPELFPRNFWDVQAAVRFLKSKAKDFGLDGRVIAMGGSAGAYMSAMLALASSHPELAYPYDTYGGKDAPAPKLDAAIPISGAYDTIAQWVYDQTSRPMDPVREGYFGGSPVQVRERYYLGSPIYHASEQNCRGTRWLIGWGTHDEVTPPDQQSKVLVAHLKMANALVRIAPVVGAPHFFYYEDPEVGDGPYTSVLAARVVAFLRTWVGIPLDSIAYYRDRRS